MKVAVRLAVVLGRSNARTTDPSLVTISDYVHVLTPRVILVRHCSTASALHAVAMQTTEQFKVSWRRKKQIGAIGAKCQRFDSTCHVLCVA
jgi:hypothetical protein